MYRITPSETARNQIEALPEQRRRELEEVVDHLASILPALERVGFVRPLRWWKRDANIYFDNTFPYAIIFERFEDNAELYIDVVLPAVVS
jgi:hypothetical protein